METKKINNSTLRSHGIDSHQVKDEYDCLPTAHFDIYEGKGTINDIKKNSFYFSFSLHIYEDIDIKEIEKQLNIKATKLVKYTDSVASNKNARIYFKTKTMTELYADEMFEKFVVSMAKKLENLPKIMKRNNSKAYASIVFTNLLDKPCISLSFQTMEILSNLNINFDVDFI